MLAIRSGTSGKLPRRMFLSVSSRKNRSTATLLRELRRARTAASLGQVRDLRRALDGAQELTQQLAEQVEQARQGYAVDEIAVLSSGDYRQELLAAASAAGVSMFEEDE